MSEKKEWKEMTMATKYQHSESSLRRDSQSGGLAAPRGLPHTYCVQKIMPLETDLMVLVLPLHKTLGGTMCDRQHVVIFSLQNEQILI